MGPEIDKLCLGEPMSLVKWLDILVPFVTCKFVRGNDFGTRFKSRPVAEIDPRSASRDGINQARMLELQRLLAPVMSAKWIVLHKSGGLPFICNDLGVCVITNPWGKPGFAIPLSSNDVLCVIPQRTRRLAEWTPDGWQALIEHRRLTRAEVPTFNAAQARAATRFVFGSQEKELNRSGSFFTEREAVDSRTTMERWPESYRLRIVHEFEWHRLAGVADKNPAALTRGRTNPFQRIKPDRIFREGWIPIPIFPMNLPDFRTGLSIQGNHIQLDMFELPGFTDSPGARPPWAAEEESESYGD